MDDCERMGASTRTDVRMKVEKVRRGRPEVTNGSAGATADTTVGDVHDYGQHGQGFG